jgi:hypothetical protein
MDRDQLFVESRHQLARLVAMPDEHSGLRIAAILRDLLVGEVNDSHRASIRITINDNSHYTNVVMRLRPALYSVEDGLDPDTALTARNPVEVSTDQFLSYRVMVVNGVDISIGQLIEQLATVADALPAGEPPTDALRETPQTQRIGGLPAATRMMRVIGRVVTKSLSA